MDPLGTTRIRCRTTAPKSRTSSQISPTSFSAGKLHHSRTSPGALGPPAVSAPGTLYREIARGKDPFENDVVIFRNVFTGTWHTRMATGFKMRFEEIQGAS